MKSPRNFYRVTFITLFACIWMYVQAESDFIERLNSIQTLSGKFTQTITDTDGEEVAEETVGKFTLKRPGRFYWETLPPYEQVVIGNEAGLYLYDPDLEQVTIYGREEFLNSPAAVLSGDAAKISEKYNITSQGDKKKQVYVLSEKDASNKSFDTLSFVFTKDQLTSLELKDQLGQLTAIVFDKVKLNKSVDDMLFVFVPPDNVDVIINQ
jgi:outer membrane lipoprotein carrier protein